MAFSSENSSASDRRDDRNPPGTVEPLAEAARGNDHRQAEKAGEKMRAFDDRQRQVVGEEFEVLVRRRRDARKHQHHAEQQREGRKQLRHQPAADAPHAGRGRVVDETTQFRRRDREDRDHQRHDVVDDAVKDQRAENRVDIHRAAEPRDDDRFENAETRRHVAENAEADGDRINGKEARPADRRVRQQHVEHGGRGGDVERGHQELPRPCTRIRQANGDRADPHLAAVAAHDDHDG